MKSKDSDKDMDYAKLFTNMMSEGFIVINSEGEISLYNDSAKEIFGLINRSKINHKKGRLEEGDIVIIGNNSFGSDDGNMDHHSLEVLGLKKSDIKKEEPFILVSRYKGDNVKKVVARENMDRLDLEDGSLGVDIKASIDFVDKLISISVDGRIFDLDYISSIGHMVVLDGVTRDLKFYQVNGYTARKESINDLLKGGDFKEKTMDKDSLDVIGRNIFDIHKSTSMIKDFFDVAKGKNIRYRDKYEVINGYPTLCTLNPVEEEGLRIGAALKVEDISKIERVIEERDRILRQLENASREIQEKKAFELAFPDFIGEDEKILDVKRLGLRASKTLSTVLLIGQAGVGKTLLAKNIHENSTLKDGEFVHINGTFLNEDLFRENLDGFGSGSLYIEEVAGLDFRLQEMLLNFIKKNEARDDIRLILSTSKNLDGRVIEKQFNEDLYYKINVFPISIPELKDRKGDLKLLVDHILPTICRRANTDIKRLSKEAFDLISTYNWPNNVRELINILERAVNLALGNNILTKHIVLLDEINNISDKAKSLKEQLEEREKVIIQSTLSLYKGDKQKAIENLRVSQSTFYEKLKKYEIN